jgi:hypothetical protein
MHVVAILSVSRAARYAKISVAFSKLHEVVFNINIIKNKMRKQIVQTAPALRTRSLRTVYCSSASFNFTGRAGLLTAVLV